MKNKCEKDGSTGLTTCHACLNNVAIACPFFYRQESAKGTPTLPVDRIFCLLWALIQRVEPTRRSHGLSHRHRQAEAPCNRPIDTKVRAPSFLLRTATNPLQRTTMAPGYPIIHRTGIKAYQRFGTHLLSCKKRILLEFTGLN
jgi:hypothetical protein